MTTIIYCHPYEKSFNHQLLQSVTDTLTALGREYYVMDLYADRFNPVLGVDSLALYSKGKSADPMVERYEKVLQQTEHAIFIFPIWWGMMPAMLKGWIDKVFLKGEIFDYTPEGDMMPCLSIKKTTLITTSQGDTEIFAPFVAGYFSPLTLQTVGFNGLHWMNCPQTAHGTDEHRRQFIDDVIAYISK